MDIELFQQFCHLFFALCKRGVVEIMEFAHQGEFLVFNIIKSGFVATHQKQREKTLLAVPVKVIVIPGIDGVGILPQQHSCAVGAVFVIVAVSGAGLGIAEEQQKTVAVFALAFGLAVKQREKSVGVFFDTWQIINNVLLNFFQFILGFRYRSGVAVKIIPLSL